MMTPAASWWKKFLRSPAAWLLALTLVFFGDLVFGGKTFLFRDGFFITSKEWLYGWSVIADGDFPLWNTQGLGKPFMENPFSACFYPPNALFAVFSTGVALKIFTLLHVWLAGAGMWWFARQLRAARWPALAAVAGVMFGTWMMSSIEFLIAYAAYTWVFFILGALALFWRRWPERPGGILAEVWRQRRWLAVVSAFFVLQITTGYNEFFIYPFAAYALFIGLAGTVKRSWRLGLALAVFLGAALALALLVTAPQWATLLQTLPFTERAATFDTRFDMGSLSAAHLLKAVFPFIGGSPGAPDGYWSPGTFEFGIGTFYTGVLAVLALPFAFLQPWRSRSRAEQLLVLWGATTALVGLLLALGENTPLYPLVWQYVPLMNKFRFASKFLLLTVSGEVALVAIGINYILRDMPTRRGVIMLAAAGAATAALALLAAAALADPALMPTLFGVNAAKIPAVKLDAVTPSIAWSLLFLILAYTWVAWASFWKHPHATAVALALTMLNLLIVARPIEPTVRQDIYDRVPAVTRHCADNRYRVFSWYNESTHQYLYADPRPDIFEWAMEAGVNAGWFPFKNVHALYQNGIKMLSYVMLMRGVYDSNPAVRNNFLDAVGARWTVGGAPWSQVLWGGASRELRMEEHPTALPRFALFTAWQSVTDNDAALRYLAMAPSIELHQRPAVEPVALMNGRITRRAVPVSGTVSSAGSLTVTADRNHRQDFTVRVSVPSALIISDTWHPGWRAKLDDMETPVYRANAAFRAIFIPPGNHTVSLDYWPPNLGWYLLASALGLLAISVLVFLPARLRACP
jgi:hypothetical protein